MTSNRYESWSAGHTYEQFMGKWSSDVALRFLEWLDIPPRKYWLDVGCGTGALTRNIINLASPELVIGLEPSLGFAQFAAKQTEQAVFIVADGLSLALADQTLDTIVSGLAINFMPQPETALLDMRRVVKPGGTVAAYVWDYADKMEFLRYFWDVAVDLFPAAAKFHEGRRFPICQPHRLRQTWQQTGLKQIVVEAIDIPTVFESFEDYWMPFTLGNFPAPNYLSSLNQTQQQQFKHELQQALPIASDGNVRLIGRVWAVRGIR